MEMRLHPFAFNVAIAPGEHGCATVWQKAHRFEDLDGWDELSLMWRVYVVF